MAPAVGRTEMRYFGISLFRMLAKVTIALWPAVPTGGVPQRMSCCAKAAGVVMPIRPATTAAVRTRLSMAFPFRIDAPPRPRRGGEQSTNPGGLANSKMPHLMGLSQGAMARVPGRVRWADEPAWQAQGKRGRALQFALQPRPARLYCLSRSRAS